jgi:hypothetical protein
MGARGYLLNPGFPIWIPLTRFTQFSITQNRSAGDPTTFCNDGHADNIGLWADWSSPHLVFPVVPCSGRTRPVIG